MVPKSLTHQLAVYLVADPEQTNRQLARDVRDALKGGVTCVQLRAKRATDREMLSMARELRTLCEAANALFLVNDRVDIALAAGADGVHLGVDDLPIEDARRLLGPEAIIGYSPETDEDAAGAAGRGANYLGVGPVYGTASKHDAGAAIGAETLRRRAVIAGIPVIGIGGITAENAEPVIRAGAVGVAVVSAILRADDPSQAATRIARAVGGALAER